MYWAGVEEASLAEIPLGATDLVGWDRAAVHGPWPPSACAARLLEWFDAGWIDLYDARIGSPSNRPDQPGPPETRHGPTGPLDREQARHLLTARDRWSNRDDETWPSVRIVTTDLGIRELAGPE